MLAITVNSCTEEVRDVLDTTGDVDIHSFKINGVEGVIDTRNNFV